MGLVKLASDIRMLRSEFGINMKPWSHPALNKEDVGNVRV